MTQQYLVGEMSVLLARLQALADDDDLATRAQQLRWEAEHPGPYTLAGVEARALDLADLMCWCSLRRGDPIAFEQQSAAGAQLHEFGVCSGLLHG